ncbi:MAG: hypothetical protein ACRDOM_03170 [Nocardioides sp.]
MQAATALERHGGAPRHRHVAEALAIADSALRSVLVTRAELDAVGC